MTGFLEGRGRITRDGKNVATSAGNIAAIFPRTLPQVLTPVND
jgi:hypothetical protein